MAEKRAATHEDANLVLRLYELRREEKMRKARDWFAFKFFPETLEDLQAITSKPGDENAYFRMVTTYWDMAASFVVSGALSADLLLASGQEMIMVWTKMEKLVPKIREQAGIFDYLSNIEQVIQMVDWAPERVRWLRERLPAFRQQYEQSQSTEPTP
jgi:hypothetical protein